MKILCIGNSFSQDACAYMSKMAASAGAELETLNLFIGGCSLETHANNIFFNQPDYDFEFCGECPASRKGSIDEALKLADWDYISIQQVSYLSGKYESYQPYLDRVISRVRDVCPKAKILIHKTWAYEIDCPILEEWYESNQTLMNELLSVAYKKAADAINADDVIPCGDVIAALRKAPEFDYANGGESLCRDGFHLNLVYGRYAAAATWLEKLNICDINNVTFLPEADDIDFEKIALIKKTVKDICK